MPRSQSHSDSNPGSKNRDLVVFGTGGFAEIAHYYFTHDSDRRVAAFCVDGEFLDSDHFQGLPVIPAEELERRFPKDACALFVAVGHGNLNQDRARKVEQYLAQGYELASFVSSRAVTAPDLRIGPNSMVMEAAFLQPMVEIGLNSIIWSTTRVGFHTVIGNHCWLVCPLLGESVTVSDHSFIGLNATICPHVRIGEKNIIGAGALILRDTQDMEVYPGDPTVPTRAKSDRVGRI